MKVLLAVVAMTLVFWGTACQQVGPKPIVSKFEQLPKQQLQTQLKVLSEKEISASEQVTVAKEAFDTAKTDNAAASEQDVPETRLRLLEAGAAYLSAQRERVEAKRELEEAQDVYLRRLLREARLQRQPSYQIETRSRFGSPQSVSQPGVSQPDVSQPSVSQPDVSQPDASQPDVGQ